MTAEPDLPINDAVPAPTKIEPGNLFLWNWRQMQVYAQACVAHAVAPLQAEIEGLREQLRLSTVDQVNAEAEANDARAEIEALRAEVERANSWNERVSVCRDHVADIVDGPCVICALDAAESRAARLAEALRELKDLMLGQVKWEPCDCGCPQQRTPDGPHSVTWLRAAQQVEIAISKAEGKE